MSLKGMKGILSAIGPLPTGLCIRQVHVVNNGIHVNPKNVRIHFNVKELLIHSQAGVASIT